MRVVHRGTWGFAAGTVQTPEAAVRLVEQAVRVAEVSAVNREPVVCADPRTVSRPGSPPTRSIPSTFPTPRRSRCSPTGPSGCSVPTPWRTWTPSPTPSSRSSVRGHQRHRHHPTARAHARGARGRRHRRSDWRLRDDAHPRPARRPRLGIRCAAPAGTGTPNWPLCPE